MGIELPPLNTALVEVHRELATVSMGAKDMAIKNKNVWKTVKLTQTQLQKAQERIAELERTTTTAQQNPGLTSNDDASTTLREEVEAQTAIAAKAKRATQLTESKIDRLRAELRQSSDREKDVWAKGRRAVKALEDKLEAETATHTRTKEENRKLCEEAQKTEAVITGLRELLEKKKAWYDEQLERERELKHQVEVRLNNEMGRLEELHLKESQIWAKMKSLYEERLRPISVKSKTSKKPWTKRKPTPKR